MEQITVVIGDRLGKGQKVAAGAEKAGARAVVVPGVAADMKLGDMMKAENATFGISFCGSGGAGAITAPNTPVISTMVAAPQRMASVRAWACSSPSNSPAYIRASWWMLTEPSAPSRLTTRRRRPRFSASS